MRLKPDQVPDFPDSSVWSVHLRWLVMVMDEDDAMLPFVASVYASCLKYGGRITHKQAQSVLEITYRVYEAWCADELQCCRHDLESMRAEGNA